MVVASVTLVLSLLISLILFASIASAALPEERSNGTTSGIIETPASLPQGRSGPEIPKISTNTSTATTIPPAMKTPTATTVPPATKAPTATSTVTPTVIAAKTPMNAIVLGAWIDQPWNGATLFDTYNSLIGVSPSVIVFAHDWVHRSFVASDFDFIYGRGATPMVTWMPNDYTVTGIDPRFALANIIRGDFDAYITSYAQQAAAYGKPFYLRLAHEMNGDWYNWGMGVNGNTSDQYIAMWRHVHDIFAANGATNARWVWCPNITAQGQRGFGDLYPGNGYVDWVALDGYNFGTSQSWSSWQSFATVFNASYQVITSLTTQPLMIAEVASAEAGGSKATWTTQGLLTDIPTNYPRIRAVLWFDQNKEADWAINSSTEALTAYARVAKAPLYQGRMP